MSKYFFPFLLLLCLSGFMSLSAQQTKVSPPAAVVSSVQPEQSGFDVLKSSMDQMLGAIAPALEQFAKKQITLAEANNLLLKAKGWKTVSKFFGGGLDCINSLKNGWDIGTALNGCISAFQNKNHPEFTKQFNELAKATVKTVAAIATTALISSATTAGAPILAVVGAGLAIGVATDYVVSKIDLTKPVDWAKNTWNSFWNKDQTPLLISVGQQKSPASPPGKLKKLNLNR